MLKQYIEIIKDRIPISDVVGRTVKLKRVGSRLVGRCPFHQEKTPSFSVNDKDKFFYCFGCGKSGDVIDFISLTKKLDLSEAVEELAVSIGLKIEKKGSKGEEFSQIFQFLEKLRDWFCLNLDSKEGREAKCYIETRLNKNAISDFMLGYCPLSISSFIKENKNFSNSVIQSSGILDRWGRCCFRGRLVFPINNRRGKVIGFGSRVIKEDLSPKYMNSCETDFFKKSEILYNIDKALAGSEESLILVEGYMDVISLYQWNYRNVIGILGTSITLHHLKALNSLGRKIVICFDGDAAGVKAAERVVKLIMGEFIDSLNIRITFSFLPEGKDPADIVKHDRGAFQSLLDNAKTLSGTLFFLATRKRALNLPEDFIDLEKVLEGYLTEIGDYKIKKHFRDFFRQQIFLLKKNLRFVDFDSTGKSREGVSISCQNLKKLASSSVYTDKKVLFLGIAIKFPEILHRGDREEYFSLLKLSDPQYEKLQSSIINLLNTSKNISSDSLAEFLLADDETAELYNLIKGSISLPDDVEKAVLLWDKVKKQLWLSRLQEEYREIINSSDLDERKMEEANRILVKIRDSKKEE